MRCSAPLEQVISPDYPLFPEKVPQRKRDDGLQTETKHNKLSLVGVKKEETRQHVGFAIIIIIISPPALTEGYETPLNYQS